MTAPDKAEYSSIWLGRFDDAPEDGWLRVAGDVRDAQLAVFERKVTVGDATKDSDDFVSSLIVSDLSGGGQVEDMNEGSDAARFWDGVADTRSPNGITLAPLATEVRPSAVTTAVGVYPLGDVYTTGNALARFACAFGTGVYLWSETSAAFGSASASALNGTPREKGTLFYSTADSRTYLYVPTGSAGYCTVTAGSGSTPTVAPVAAAAQASTAVTTGKPGAVSFAVFNNQLWALDTVGQLWYTTDGATWTKFVDGTGAFMAALNPSRVPKKLLAYYDRLGEIQLYVVTDRDVWTVDIDGARWTLTNLQFPPHPDFGLDACVWRAGEDLWVAAGADAVKFTAAGVVVPLAGLARDDGLPVYKAGRIVSFQPEPSTLWALVQASGAGQFTQLHGWTGIGWHKLWEQAYPVSGAPSWLAVQTSDNGYRLWWGLAKGYAVHMTLPREMYNARQGVAAGMPRAASGTVVTGWFDASMSGFDKLASHVTIDMEAASSTETLSVGYICDTDVPTGIISSFGTSGSGNGQLDSPYGIVDDGSGGVYVSEYSNHRVQRFDSSGSYLSKFGSFGTGNGQFNGPGGLARDASGNIYVVDTFNHRVQKFNSAGTYQSQFGSSGSGNGQFNTPAGIAIDSSGNIWIADTLNHRIQKFNSAGTYQSQFGSFGTAISQLHTPVGIVVDGSGKVWVAENGNMRIQRFDASGVSELTVGTNGSGDGQFVNAQFVAIDASGNLWVTDRFNNRVQKFSSGGTWLAGAGAAGTTLGRFDGPRGIVVSGSNVYIADFNNDRIQVFTDTLFTDPNAADTYPKTFTALGTASANGTTKIRFDPDGDGFAEGKRFNRIRFALTLARDSLATRLTPVLRAFNFHYTKIPQNTASYAFDVLLPRSDMQWDLSAAEIRDRIADLLTADEFLKLVVNGVTERVRVAGASATRATGDDYSGVITLSLIAIRGQ